jgi:hypothetical protein
VLSSVIVPMSRVTVRSTTATAARFVCTLYVTRRHLYLYLSAKRSHHIRWECLEILTLI